MQWIQELLEAVGRSLRSERDISIAAVGHGGAIRNLRSNDDLRVSTLEALCRELGLEFYVGAQRRLVPAEVALELGLEDDCEVQDVVGEIQNLKSRSADAIREFKKQVAKELQNYRSETARHIVEILREQAETNPIHLRNVPFHAVPFATAVREAGPEAVELSLAPIGLSFKRADIAAEAEWLHLVSIIAPGEGRRDLIALDMMRAAAPKGEALLLDVSDREFARGIAYDYLTLGREGLDVRRIGRSDDNELYSDPTTRSSFGQPRPRRPLSPGEWVIGRIAGTAPAGSLFAE